MVALGPALGFLMGSALLSQWINIGDDQNHDGITKNDPRWVGRWWMGFLISSSLLIIFSLFLSTFPSYFQRDDNQPIDSIDDLSQSNTSIQSTNSTQVNSLFQLSKIKGFYYYFKYNEIFFIILLIDIFSSIIELVTNPTYLLIVLINSVENVS
jgi:MFS family permease